MITVNKFFNKVRNSLEWRLSKYLPDKAYLSYLYKHYMGKPMNWENPITYNEKLNWLKIYYRNPLYTTLVDKLAVKQFVAERIGGGYYSNITSI